MRTTESLLALAQQAGIVVRYRRLNGGVLGQYDRSRRIITLHSGLLRDERWLRVVLAHELGHHFTWREGCQEPQCLEARADRWAQQALISDDEIREQWRSWVTEMADRYGVPESWLSARLGSAGGGILCGSP